MFGRVIRGYDEVVEKLAAVPVDEKDRPHRPIVIVNCGELELKRKEEANQGAAASRSPDIVADIIERQKRVKGGGF